MVHFSHLVARGQAQFAGEAIDIKAMLASACDPGTMAPEAHIGGYGFGRQLNM
jgi:hypothetical protein